MRINNKQEIEEFNPDLMDYKFFCFNGKPRFLKVDFDRFIDHHANYYDINWNLLPFGEKDYCPIPEHIIEKPDNFSEMVKLASILSESHTFIRVDFYNANGRILFGELTFFPYAGIEKFTSDEWEKKVGDMIKLPIDK